MNWKHFKAPNLGLLVYKLLYTEESVRDKIRIQDGKLEIDIPKDAKTTPFDPLFKFIYETKLSEYSQIENHFAGQKFSFFTTYPGLLLGTGYTHDSNAKGDIKIGFYFDHTTGQPVIPGSSIKGVLKSVFENEKDVTDNLSVHNIRFFIEEILQDCDNSEKPDWQNLLEVVTYENIALLRKLKEDIFGNHENEGKDIFFDAVIDIIKTGANKNFLANDFITPHPNPLKNPTPLMFLKVLPNIAFEFRFLLTDSEITEKDNPSLMLRLKAKNKELLFRKILLTVGIGAKTNVGYGQFDDRSIKNKDQKMGSSGNLEINSPHQKTKELNSGSVKVENNVLKPDEVIATYLEPDTKMKNYLKLKILTEGNFKDFSVSVRYPSGMEANQKAILTLSLDKKKAIQSATIKRLL